MGETSRPWDGIVTGDAGPYSAAQWRTLYQYALAYRGEAVVGANNGPLLGSGSGTNAPLKVVITSPASAAVRVATGAAIVQGAFYLNDAFQSLAIAANGAGNPRIDTIVLRLNTTTQTIRLAVLQGTAAASPVRLPLTQAGAIWEIPLADVAVAAGFSVINIADITNYPQWANAPSGLYYDYILNNSGGELKSNDVVIADTSADRAATTTTTPGMIPLGVWQGITASTGFGRVLREGIGYVNASAAVTRGNRLCVSATAKQAAVNGAGVVFATALETTSGAGPVLCRVHVEEEPVGALKAYMGAVTGNVPDGWLLAYGQAVSRATYAALFARLGTTYGVGDTTTTFNLPDLRGRVPVGLDNMGGVAASRVAAATALNVSGGAETVTLDLTMIPAHTHTQNAINTTAGTAASSVRGSTAPDNAAVGPTSSAGGGLAHQNMPPWLDVNWLVKF